MPRTTESQQQRLLTNINTVGERLARLRAELESVEQDKLIPLLREGEEAGLSLRTLGTAAGLSHVTVMRMLGR